MIRTIPLTAGLAFQQFRVDLSGTTVQLTLRWSTRFGLYSVDLHEGQAPIALGRGLHPGIDLLNGLNRGFGKLYLEGEAPTVENLGINNKLRHES